jgi:peptidase MA superfamily protein/tetratricopeptide repeat protein
MMARYTETTMMVLLAAAFVAAAQMAQPATADGWSAAGWRALRAGAAEEAAGDFSQALRIDAGNALALLGAGAAANMRGRGEEARQHLVGALKADPSLTAAALLLGEILYREADLQGAIAVYEQALARTPGDPKLTARLDTWRREAAVHDTFSTRLATHFTILFEGPADQPMAGKVSEMLESIYWQVGGALGAYPPNVLTVVLYSKEQFRDITQSPSWAGGVYDGRIRVPMAGRIDERDLQRVLTHEFTHAVIHSLAPRGVPQWLNEGLAVLMERGGGQAAPLPADADVPPLARLEGSFEKLSPGEARLAYGASAAATQALLDRGGPMVIYNLLTNLGAGMRFDEAFERAALVPYREFAQTWR